MQHSSLSSLKKMQQLKSKDFSPISLAGGGVGVGVYKIITKVLATRLRTIMEEIFQLHKMLL